MDDIISSREQFWPPVETIDLHVEGCRCDSCTYQPGEVNQEASTYINRYLLEDLGNLDWAVRREIRKYHKWEVPSYLEEALKHLKDVDVALNRYRTNELNLPKAE